MMPFGHTGRLVRRLPSMRRISFFFFDEHTQCPVSARYYLDPVLSLVIVVIISGTTWPLLRDSTLVLLNSIPQHIDLLGVENSLLEMEHVVSVHELHVWRLVGSR